jgi:hypothetical protein
VLSPGDAEAGELSLVKPWLNFVDSSFEERYLTDNVEAAGGTTRKIIFLEVIAFIFFVAFYAATHWKETNSVIFAIVILVLMILGAFYTLTSHFLQNYYRTLYLVPPTSSTHVTTV